VINDPTAFSRVAGMSIARLPTLLQPEIKVSSILDIVQQELSGGSIQQIAQHAGVDPSVAQRAVETALPMIVGAINQHASQPGNVTGAQPNATPFGDASALLGGLSGMFGDQAGGMGGVLGKVIGSRQAEIQNEIAGATGIDKDKAARILQALIPMVMAALARRTQQAQAPQPSAPEARP